jgi:hypothetical protein
MGRFDDQKMAPGPVGVEYKMTGIYILKTIMHQKKLTQYLLFLFIFFINGITSAQYVGLSPNEISSLKKLIKKDSAVSALYGSLKRTADAALNETPNPIDTVVSEGHLSTDPKKIITQRSLKDIDRIYALAFAYVVEDNKSYLQKLTEYLVAWATINKPQGNPINDTKFESLFIAYDLAKKNIASSERNTIDAWLKKMADEEINTGKNKNKSTSKNNWNSHRLKVIGCIAYITDKRDYKRYIDSELVIQLEKNLYPDGSGFDFHERDALHYHVYTLEPLVSLATVLKRATKKDFYNYTTSTGASINRSMDFLLPFVTGEKTHPEYVNSKVAFDKKRADNKEAGFEIGANFKSTHAIPLLTSASYFEPALMKTVLIVTGINSEFPNWQAVLNYVRK